MVKIFPETHKKIVREINKDISVAYGINLNIKKLEWASISPDILPKYKFIRHYQDESINYIVKEIITTIYLFQFVDLKNLNPFQSKLLSKKLGVISHYLSDYVCLPHTERWTCDQHLRDHIGYERQLNKMAQDHVFNKNIIERQAIDLNNNGNKLLKFIVKEYIEDIVQEYRKETDKTRDLDFAYCLNYNIFAFVFETVEALSTARNLEKAFVF